MNASYMNKSLSDASTSLPKNDGSTPTAALPKTPLSLFRKPADGFTPTTRFPKAGLRSPWVRTPMTTAVQRTPSFLQKTLVNTAFSTPSDLDSTQMESFLQTAVSTPPPSSLKNPKRLHQSYTTAIDLDSSDDWGLLDSRPTSVKNRFSPYKKSVSCSDLKTAASIESTLTALSKKSDVSRLSTACSPATLTMLDRSLNWTPKSFGTLKTCWIGSSAHSAFSPKVEPETVGPIALVISDEKQSVPNEKIPLEMAKKIQMLEEMSILHGNQLDKTRDRLDILVDSLLRTIGMLNSAVLRGQAQEEKIKTLEETIRRNNA